MHDAMPGDVYVDSRGNCWRIIGVCHEPTVIAKAMEPMGREYKAEMRGGVSGLMWNGFKRIYRAEQNAD